MAKYYTYYCAVSEIDTDTCEVETLIDVNTNGQHKVPRSKLEAINEVRAILDAHAAAISD